MVRALWTIFLVVLAVTVILEFFIQTHPHFAIERLFAFNAVYGFLACAALILVAKAIGLLVKREEGYYGREDRDGE
jgi:hypothetical protein